MKRWILSAACPALLLALGACDPVETELTLNADGSGKLTQQARLSPAARLLLREAFPPEARGYSPILTEEAAKNWSAANPDAGVKVLSFVNRPQPDGSLRIEYEVSFADVSAFAETVWGWPFQIGSAGVPEGVRVQFQDPVRFVTQQAMGRVAATNGFEPAAVKELLAALSPGLKLRTRIHLPAPARSVEGAALADNRQELVAEQTALGDGEGLTQWLQRSPATALFPAEAIQFKAFAVPVEMDAERVAPWAKPVEGGRNEEGFLLQLGTVSASSSRYINYATPNAEPRVDERVTVNLTLQGPADTRLLTSRPRDGAGQPLPLLSAVRDGQGNDLRTPDTMLYFYPTQGWPLVRARDKGRPLGSAQVTLKLPAGGSRLITVLEGYFAAQQVTEEGRLEIRPLAANLNKAFDLGGCTIQFTAVKGASVEYTVSRKDGKGADWPLDIRGYSADGRELPRATPPSAEPARASGQHLFGAPLPADGYVVVLYPARVRELRLPFAFKDIRIP